MQNITLARIKTPPMLIGLCIASLLLFAVVGVVKEVSTMNTSAPIQSNVAAGLRTLQQPTVAPTMAASLPAFSLQPTAQQPGGEWLEVRQVWGSAPKGSPPAGGHEQATFVFADWWYSCRYVAVGGAYYAVGNGYAVAGWPGDEQFQALPAITRRDIGEVCHGQ